MHIVLIGGILFIGAIFGGLVENKVVSDDVIQSCKTEQVYTVKNGTTIECEVKAIPTKE